MSWLVKTLLRDRFKILSSEDINSDEYNDLLCIESVITKMKKSGLLTEEEVQLLDLFSIFQRIQDLSKELNCSRDTVSDRLSNVCNKIAFVLGDRFTDEGFLSELAYENSLTDEQIEKARRYISGNRKFSETRRKIND